MRPSETTDGNRVPTEPGGREPPGFNEAVGNYRRKRDSNNARSARNCSCFNEAVGNYRRKLGWSRVDTPNHRIGLQ